MQLINCMPQDNFSSMIILPRTYDIHPTMYVYQFWLQQDQQKHDIELQGVTPFFSASLTAVAYKQTPVFHQLLLLQQCPRILQLPQVYLYDKEKKIKKKK